MIQEWPTLDALIVCAGGGGFISGCAVAAQHLTPGIQVFASEPERGNDIEQSLRAGKIVTIHVPRTICDGQQTQAPGKLTFEIMRERLAGCSPCRIWWWCRPCGSSSSA